MKKTMDFGTNVPVFETHELRKSLKKFMDTQFGDPSLGQTRKIGSFTWGVYAFYDFDDEPIYVGQTREQVSSRVGRHLTGQRTDAVAKSVLDPFEVKDIEVWPLPKSIQSIGALNAIEYSVHQKLIRESIFGAILNEKDPPKPDNLLKLLASIRGTIVSEPVMEVRSHPDFRIARRAQVIAKLSQGIAERQVDIGLRRVLLVQAQRLELSYPLKFGH